MATKEELLARYRAAAHQMQTGVAMMMNFEPGETTSKHLRVGVNSAMVDSGSLAELLVKKGIITELEHMEALVEGMEREAAKYLQRVRVAVGSDKVDLG